MSEQAVDKPVVEAPAPAAAAATATPAETAVAPEQPQAVEKKETEESTPVANGTTTEPPPAEKDEPTTASTTEAASNDKAPEQPATDAPPAATETTAAAESAAEPAAESAPKKQDEEAAPGAAAAPAATDSKPEEKGKEPAAEPEQKPDYITKTPALGQFFEKLPAILSKTGHGEMWGVSLKEDYKDVPTVNILTKFLRANEGNLALAEGQLTKALEWRKKLDPVALLEKGLYNADKFSGLGYKTTYKVEGGNDLVVTWNIYGGVKNNDETFGNLDE